MNIKDFLKNSLQESDIDYSNYSVEVIDKSIQYSDFFEKFMSKNLPCIIKGISDDWECTRKWIELDDNKINFDFLTSTYGNLEAPVADCANIVYNTHCKSNMKVANYLAYLKEKTDKLLYLKDWHLKRLQPADNFYEVPILFASDWLNEYCEDNQEDDFMFVYIGPKDTWTSLHSDVYCSYSWSVNIVGRKKWLIFPPGEENKLKDKLGNIPMQFDHEVHKNVKYFEVIQEKGEALFVPSGWYHQVNNTLDTISINHNWINGCNIEKVWEALERNLISVEHEIEVFKDSDDFIQQCQLILKALFGMDLQMFVKFVCHIGGKRLQQLEMEHPKWFGNYPLGINHIKFDLSIILKMMNIIDNHPLLTNKNVIPSQLHLDFNTLKEEVTSKI